MSQLKKNFQTITKASVTMTDNRTNKYAGFLARQNHQRDSRLGIGVKCLCGRLFDLDADHALHQVDEILRAALVAAAGVAPRATGSTSDGYHTFDELYEYRMLYNAHAAHGWLAAGIPVVKSWKHSDGEPCFGGGWFIVTATLPAGQVSNHYEAKHWGLFRVPEVELPPEYDGHTPHDAAMRLRIEAEHAAPGAAPPAPSEYAYCPIHGDLLAANRSYRCGNAPTGHEYAAPVQPSSTVDEAEARIAEAAKLHRPTLPGFGPKSCVHDGRAWPCPDSIALGLNEGENDK